MLLFLDVPGFKKNLIKGSPAFCFALLKSSIKLQATLDPDEQVEEEVYKPDLEAKKRHMHLIYVGCQEALGKEFFNNYV